MNMSKLLDLITQDEGKVISMSKAQISEAINVFTKRLKGSREARACYEKYSGLKVVKPRKR